MFCFRGIKPIKGICLTNHTHDVHLHTRNRETGKPDHSPAAFAAFPPRIKQSTRCCGKLTSGGAPYMGIEERIQPAIAFKPEFASLNMGSLNFGLFPMLERFKEFRHFVGARLPGSSRDLVFRNTFRDVDYALPTCASNSAREPPSGQSEVGSRRLRTSRPLPITHHRALLFLFGARSQCSRVSIGAAGTGGCATFAVPTPIEFRKPVR